MLLWTFYRRHLRLALQHAVGRGEMLQARVLDVLIQECDFPNGPSEMKDAPVSR